MVSEQSATSGKRPKARVRRFGVALLAVVLVISTVLAAGYAAFPSLLSAASPMIAERLGLTSLHIAANRPTLNHIVIRELDVADSSITASGSGITVEYTLRGLWRGVVENIDADRLSVTFLPRAENAETAAASPLRIPELPFNRLTVSDLLLHAPEVGFSGAGSASLSEEEFDVELNGLTPEAASRFSLRAGIDRQGTYTAHFFDRGNEDDPFVEVSGIASEHAITIDASVDLRDYALELASSLLQAPKGTGSIRGRFTTEVPWPIPEPLDWRDLSAEVEALSLEWQSASSPLTIESLQSSARVSNGRVDGSIRGEITHSVADTDIRVSIVEDMSFNYGADTIRSDEGSARILASRDGMSVDAVIRSVNVQLAEVPRGQASINFDADNSGVRATGEARVDVAVESLTEPRLHGDMTLDASVEAAGTERPIQLSADFGYAGHSVSISGNASSGIVVNAPLSISHNVEANRGSADFEYNMRLDEPLIGSLLDAWDDEYDLTGGALDLRGKISWAEAIEARLEVDLANGTAFTGETTASGITTELEMSWDDITKPLGWQLSPATIAVSSANVGFPITNITIPVAGSQEALSFRSMTAEVLGGDLAIDPFEYDPDAGSAQVNLRLTDVSLGELLALEGEDITGSGRIDSVLPVQMADNVPRVEDGTFEAQPPGGTIAIAQSFAPQSGQPGLDFALRALTDFRYTGLSGNVDYSENGDLQLTIRLDGNNPAIEQGRAIRYNLTISENVPALLESLRLSDRFTERLQEGVND